MDFELTEDQQQLRLLTRQILTGHVTAELLREVDASNDRFDAGTWQALADANLLGIALPERHGGSGYGLVEQCIVLEEIGRALAPVPAWASSVLGAMTVARHGTEDQQKLWVSRAAVGEVVLFNLNLGLRLALWFVLLGPAGFLAFYGVSIASNVTILAHINYACHRDAPDGDVHIVNLDGTLYYRLANAITSGGYFHKSHHDHPHLFDPRSAASETPIGGRAGYFDLDGLWGKR